MVLIGIEFALAVIPLIIAGTEHYRKAFEKSKTAARQKVKNEKLLDFYRNLHTEISLLDLSLRCLISDLPTIPEQQKAQLLEHDRKQWKDAAVAVALSERLGGAEDAFKDILDTMLKTLENIISDRSLHLVGTDIVCHWPHHWIAKANIALGRLSRRLCIGNSKLFIRILCSAVLCTTWWTGCVSPVMRGADSTL